MRKEIFIDAVILFVVIIFLWFFSLTLIPSQGSMLGKGIILLGFILAVIAFNFLLLRVRSDLLSIDKLVLLYCLTFFISSYMAKVYWGQSLGGSIKGIMYFYVFFLYFVLLSLEISAQRILTIVKILFFISLLVFAVDFVTFPNPLFAWRSGARRGGMTVFFYGQGFTFLGAFYFLERFSKERKTLFLILSMVSFIFLFFMTQSRMILIAIFGGVLFLFIKSNFKRKYVITVCTILGLLLLFYKTDLFNGIKKVNKTQAAYYEENIRFQSQKFFLFELQKGIPTILFGNGVPAKDSHLARATKDGTLWGYYAADVGITGIYNYFGILGAIIWILFFVQVFKSKGNNYIKAYFFTLLTTVFTGYYLFSPGFMPATVLALYLIRCNNPSIVKDSDSVEKRLIHV